MLLKSFACVCALLALCVEANTTCDQDQFECSWPYWYPLERCINQTKACDGFKDCFFGYDEKNCTTCNGEAKMCHDGSKCVHSSKWCDGYSVCHDQSDETNCITCKPGAKKCDDGSKCVHESLLCNGWDNCSDESDEMNCTTCNEEAKLCDSGLQCRLTFEWCDGMASCYDSSDEKNCSSCQYGAVHCYDGLQCVTLEEICDDLPQCFDGSDEWFCRACQQQMADGRIQCVGQKEPCDDRHVLVGYNKWDKVTHCSNETSKTKFQAIYSNITCRQLMGPCEGRRDRVCGNDQWICEEGTHTNLSQCSNGNFIPTNYRCDRLHISCNDDQIENGLGFKCSGTGRKDICVLPQINIYDDEPQCADKSDICFVDGQFICFLCLDKRMVVSQQQVCDGVADCYDLSDECLCDDQTVCHDILGDARHTCPPNQMHCQSETDCVDMDKVLCNPKVSCVGESNTKYCSLSEDGRKGHHMYCRPTWFSPASSATKCDGRPECWGMEDECNGCEPRPKFCDMKCMDRSARFGFACKGVNISTFSCDERGLCPKRHDCASGELTSIDVNNLCDGTIDCDDGSDEDTTRCSETRFYCRNGKPLSVDINLVEDGFPQCSDGSDELTPIKLGSNVPPTLPIETQTTGGDSTKR